MPKPQFFRNVGLGALVLGLMFLAGNLYLAAAHYPKLASLCFMLVILCDTVFAVSAILWVYSLTWSRVAQPPPMQMSGPPKAMPGDDALRRSPFRGEDTAYCQARLSTVFSKVAPATVMFHLTVQL
jgi:hypothetical protein